MQIDRHIAIWAGWIAGPAFGVAMMAAPEYLKLEPVISAILFWGGLAVFFLTIIVVSILALHDAERKSRVIGPIITMAIGTLVLGGGAGWYFWEKRPPDHMEQPKSLTLAKLSDEELRDRAVEFAARIRKFEISAQSEAYAIMAGPNDPPPPANFQDEKARGEWLKVLNENRQRDIARGIQRRGEISTVFRNEYSYNAAILEAEIKDRLEKRGRFGPYGKASERMVLTGAFAGPTPISNFADYLERIARSLTN